MVLIITIASLISIPLIKVDVAVGAPGQVRPDIERLIVYAAVAGKIESLSVKDNQPVKKGDVLLTIDSASIDARILNNEKQDEENERILVDLGTMLDRVASALLSKTLDRFEYLESREFSVSLPQLLRSPQCIRQHSVLLTDIQRLLLQRGKALHGLTRNQALHAKGLLTDADFDDQQYAVKAVEQELELLLQQTLNQWQTEKMERELKKLDLSSESKQLKEQKTFYTIRAPIDGTALGFIGLQPGLYLPASQSVGEISPGGDLQADVYISPRDVGFVETGQLVNLQIDAFPYTEWGMIKGRVRHISQDFVQFGQQFAFKAVVDLDRTRLESATGAIVDLRRGMTVNARFVVKERTLFNVLYSKISDSLDPRTRAKSGG